MWISLKDKIHSSLLVNELQSLFLNILSLLKFPQGTCYALHLEENGENLSDALEGGQSGSNTDEIGAILHI